MKYRFFLLTGLFLIFALGCKRGQNVSVVASTSIGEQLPFAFIKGGDWKPESEAEFVKIHIYPEEPINFKGVSIESCSGNFNADILMYLNFDERLEVLKANGKKASIDLQNPFNARSITFNFQKNKNLCLSNLKITNPQGSTIKFETPKTIQGEIIQSKDNGMTAYDPFNLFDSRFEYSWASASGDKNISLEFNFKDDQKITSMKIWNGYQRSVVHCQRNGRLKKLKISGDNGFSDEFLLKDIMGSQGIDFKKPFQGKKLKLQMSEVYPGELEGLMISELRFYNGLDAFILDPLSKMKEIAKKNLQDFSQANLKGILNHSLSGSERETQTFSPDDRFVTSQAGLRMRNSPGSDGQVIGKIPYNEKVTFISQEPDEIEIDGVKGRWTRVDYQGNTGWVFSGYLEVRGGGPGSGASKSISGNWTLRLRSDGSLYIEGNTEEETSADYGSRREVLSGQVYALGNYSITKAKDDQLDLKIFGFLRQIESKQEFIERGMDCNGCGYDCNLKQGGSGKKESVFIENITIKNDKGKFLIRHQDSQRKIQFKKLNMALQ